MKPRQKVVTAEDVASSLYYLHVSSPEDESLLQTADYENGDESRGCEELPPELPRRQAVPEAEAENCVPAALKPGASRLIHHPLPPLPPYPLNNGPTSVSAHTAIKRKPVIGVPRKPAPPTRNRETVSFQPIAFDQTAPLLQRNASLDSESHDVTSGRPFLTKRPTLATIASERVHIPEVTVIRRNPVNGEQWNVASISDLPVFDVASEGQRGSMISGRIRKSGQPLHLTINNPGYQKFVVPDDHSRTSRPPGEAKSSADDANVVHNVSIDQVFSRRMWLEGSLFEKQARQSHQKSLSADHADNAFLAPRPTFSSANSSDSSLQYSSIHTESEAPTVHSASHDMYRLALTGENKRSYTRGYTFLSPWNGRCEFTSGVMGNSLKCRHLRGRRGNSLAPEAAFPEQVSELRFNLPGGGPLASSETRQRSPPKSARQRDSRRSRILAKFSDKSLEYHDGGNSTATEDRLDLSLGQELAGGGFAGKQAKLGKLIVQGDGLQMLDLIVTANMALWFRAYEKYQESR